MLVVLILLQLPGLQDSPDDGEVWFGFADLSGERILLYTPDPIDLPDELYAVLSSGEILRADPLGFYEEASGNYHRQTAGNFDALPGHRFMLQGTVVPAGITILIASGEFMNERLPLVVTPLPPDPVDGGILANLESYHSRDVAESWLLAGLGENRLLVLVRYEPDDTVSLASLVLVDDSTLVFEDYEGEPMNSTSVWRVDDGGEFQPYWFGIIAAMDSRYGLEIVRTWIGPEGESTALLRADGSGFREILSGYRYQAPL